MITDNVVINGRLISISPSGAMLPWSRMTHCDLIDITFGTSILSKAVFDSVLFRNVDFSEAQIAGCTFIGCMFDSCNFGDNDLSQVKFANTIRVDGDGEPIILNNMPVDDVGVEE